MTNHFESCPEAEAILGGDLQRELPQEVREALLDVVLAWANLDMATAFFLASVSKLSPDQGADKFGRKEIADKLKRASTALNDRGEQELASRVCKIAEAYPDKALLRRRIAHSRCAGVRKSIPSSVIFLPFEREGPPGNLALEIIQLSKFVDATKWANEVHEDLMQYVDAANFFEAG